MTMEKKIKIGLIILILILTFTLSMLYMSQKAPKISDAECIDYFGKITNAKEYTHVNICKDDADFDKLYNLLYSSIENEPIIDREHLLMIANVRINTTSGKSFVYAFGGWQTEDGKIVAREVNGPMGLRHTNDNFAEFVEIISEKSYSEEIK